MKVLGKQTSLNRLLAALWFTEASCCVKDHINIRILQDMVPGERAI